MYPLINLNTHTNTISKGITMTRTLIKQYNKEPNPKQRASMASHFKDMAYLYLLEGHTVIMQTSDYYKDASLLASLLVDGRVVLSRKIGARGGLTVVGDC